jgi:hypothetical protein
LELKRDKVLCTNHEAPCLRIHLVIVGEYQEGKTQLSTDVIIVTEGKTQLSTDVVIVTEGKTQLSTDVVIVTEGKTQLSTDVVIVTEELNSKIHLRSALFWDITRRRVVIVYRRFGTTCRSHLHGSRVRVDTFTDKKNMTQTVRNNTVCEWFTFLQEGKILLNC